MCFLFLNAAIVIKIPGAFYLFASSTGIKTKVVDVTKKDQVEALAKDHDHIDVLFNVAGYVHLLLL